MPSVQELNPKYKEQVGNCIYDFVLQQVGQDHAPKVTGMLIDLPIEEIKKYMASFEMFTKKVDEANKLLQAGLDKTLVTTTVIHVNVKMVVFYALKWHVHHAARLPDVFHRLKGVDTRIHQR